MNKLLLFIGILILLTIPTFWRMLRPGIYTMQDPIHYFRLIEFDKCFSDRQLPCRWAPDAGFGYGEPVFNFYGQASYAIGEIFHLSGLSFVDSLKFLFILSLVGSAISMFFLSRYLWKNNLSALVSSVLYVYAPYRAVDVWVRGTLPEALSFVLFPLILLSLTKFIEKEKNKDLLALTFLVFLLIVTHNLSLLLFAPVLVVWTIFRVREARKIYLMKKIILGLALTAIMSAFYILPIIFESRYVNLRSTIEGYFDFRGHFATLNQLLISRFWGYGASLFKETQLSRSVGHLQWILPLLTLAFFYKKREIAKHKDFLVLIGLGWFSLFLTHNASTFIWLSIHLMSYIQFPWRFLGMAVFCFSLASGAMLPLLGKYKTVLATIIILAVILINFSFFREDIWQNVSDRDMLTGDFWKTEISASIGDFWPKFGGNIPTHSAPEAFSKEKLMEKTSNTAVYEVENKRQPDFSFPIAYFPGWSVTLNGMPLKIFPDKDGLISVRVPYGIQVINFSFEDTPPRTTGNIVSILGLAIFTILVIKPKLKRITG